MTAHIYSALYGGYDLIPQAPKHLLDTPTMYTDGKEIGLHQQGWEPRYVNHGIATLNGHPARTGPMLAHKWWKFMAGRDESDITVWMDASMTALVDELDTVAEDLLGEADMLLVRHPWRTTVHEEAIYSASLPRYAGEAESILQQNEHYKAIGFPDDQGLFASGFHVRRDTPAVRWLMDQWWQECITWSHQDQLSLPVLVWLAAKEGHHISVRTIGWDDVITKLVFLGGHLK